jgi:hypothetical protein
MKKIIDYMVRYAEPLAYGAVAGIVITCAIFKIIFTLWK